jgi:molybdopterin-containing oxidoreductase family membrane subunit
LVPEEAMAIDRHVFGVFPDEERTVAAIGEMHGTTWAVERVHSPFPSRAIMAALDLKKSPVGYFTLAGGILGFFTGIGLAVFTVVQWNIIVSGKPVIAWFPFIIVGFEFTILFSVFGNVLGLLICGDLPDFRGLKHYDPRCSGEHFGILALCREGEQERLVDFFRSKGGEATVFD